jgi:putative salt-induced outer membrane protein
MKTRLIFLSGLLSISLLGSAFAEDAPKPDTKPWKNETELSVLSSNGNTKSSSSSGKNTFNYKWTRTSLELIGGGLGSSSNQQTTAERYFASQKVAYSLDERNYTFEKGGWEKDRFAGIKDREEENVGLGRAVMARPKDLITAELGVGYTAEARENQKQNNFTSGRAYSKYVHTISDTAKFTQDAEYLHDFDNPDDFRVNTETALIAALSIHFSLKVSYVWKYVGAPPVGFGRSDTTTSVSLIAVY